MEDALEILMTVNIVLAAILLLGGGLLRFAAKPDPEASLGYKTRLASVSGEARGIANRLCGRLWMLTGAAALAAVLIVMLAVQPNISDRAGLSAHAVILALQIAAGILAIVKTEHRLKKQFDSKA